MKKKAKWFQPGMLPIAFLVVLWPCLVHMDMVKTRLEEKPWFPSLAEQSDFFMHIRSISLVLVSCCMLIILIDRVMVQRQKLYSLKAFWPLAVYAVLAVLSTVFSVDRQFSLLGMAEQYETIWVLLSYLVVFWYCFDTIRRYGNFRSMVALVLAGAAIQGVIGLSQLSGRDFWQSAVGQKLLLLGTNTVQELEYSFSSEGSTQLYLSFYNPNYAAVYLVMMLPLGVAAIFYFSKIWQKILCAVLTAVLLVCLWGTGSKAGFLVVFALVIIGGFLYMNSWKKKMIFCGAFLAGCLVIGGASLLTSQNSMIGKIKKSLFHEKNYYKLQDIALHEDSVEITFDKKKMYLQIEEEDGKSWFSLLDENGEGMPLDYNEETGMFSPQNEKYKNLALGASRDEETFYIYMQWRKVTWQFVKGPEDDAYRYINLYGKPDVPENAPYIFGEGYERALSGRVYLWNRTLPLLKKYIVTGSGPDTYALVFPQNDYVMRSNMGVDSMMQIISKPHSFYLQAAVQTGVLSLLALILFFGGYVKRAGHKKWELSLLLSVLGFLIMGITNDSVVAVSPLFWALLGAGCALSEKTV